MIDDALTLKLPPPDALPAGYGPIAAGVTLYPADDGEGMARMYAVTPDGAVHCLTPPPDAPSVLPPVALTTAASHGPTSYVPLATDAPVATYLGVAHRDIAAGETFAVTWPQLGGAAGWYDVALLAAPATTNNPQLDLVAAADVTASAGVTGPVAAMVTATAAIPRGTSLWVALAAWPVPGASLPQVMAGVHPSLHAAVNLTPGWRPTGVGQPAGGWSIYAGADHPSVRPLVATVLTP
jgi:hypothetical protein